MANTKETRATDLGVVAEAGIHLPEPTNITDHHYHDHDHDHHEHTHDHPQPTTATITHMALSRLMSFA
jgi:hypothetical protein